jgi:two-component system, OmpR family, sensor histidine kinase CpxA
MKQFRQLLIKVFAWFWSSIAVTMMILLLIASFGFKDIVHKPLRIQEAKPLMKAAKFLERRVKKVPTPRQLQKLLHRSSRKRVLFLKGPTANDSIVSHNLPEVVDLDLLSPLDELPPQQVYAEYFHATGPIKLVLNNQQYYLYEVTPKRHPPLMIKFGMMPLWIKLLVPILVSLGLSFLFSRSIVRPIKALSETAGKIGEGHLAARVPDRFVGKDELGELVGDFNNMAAQLETSTKSQKRLLADISHELRSPLTRLSLAAGLAKENNCPEAKREEYLKRIIKEADQLDEMIASVLMLSRLETDQQHIEKQTVALADLLTPLIQDAEFEANSCGKHISVEILPNAEICVDDVLMASAIENTLRNAIRYANKNIWINVVLDDAAGQANITITDDGPGIDESIISKITEPFYRHSDARERESGGAGLGLAIAKKAMLAHGGDIKLANRSTNEGTGLQVTLWFNQRS